MDLDEIIALFKRRGVLWPLAEIYGGAQGLFDYGPAGASLKRRVEEAWAAWFLDLSPHYYRIEPGEILPEAVVRASGHLENFADLEVVCGHCNTASRADVLLEEHGVTEAEGMPLDEVARLLKEKGIACPRCGEKALGVPRPFNLMFSMDFGPVGREKAYLRPETAQNSYLAFERMWEVGRKQLPLGIAVIGRAFRNEIAPRQGLYRMRAFTQAELQIFFDPEDFPVPWEEYAEVKLPVLRAAARARGETQAVPTSVRALVEEGELPAFYVYHLAEIFRFFTTSLGLPAERLRFLEKNDKERAFYNRIHMDLEGELSSLGGFRELGALHYRGDYDLSRHGRASGKDLSVTTAQGKKLLPHVLEVTFGVDRNVLALADLFLAREAAASGADEEARTIWKLPTYLAPTPVAVLPLMRREHSETAERLAGEFRARGVPATVGVTGSIGRRYAREDELGTPLCVTVDAVTLEDGTVTVRRRDSREQERFPMEGLVERLRPVWELPRPVSGHGRGPSRQ